MGVSGGVSAGLGLLLTVCLGVGLLVAGGVADAEEPPVADAGLDQSVEPNATVYLDAGGSYDPDGEVAAYRWSVVAPDGTAFEPDCVTCERTRFRATQAGQYNVTVTVTDATGARTDDMVYVTVATPDPPNLQLSGPESTFVGGDGTVRADVTAGDDPLSRLVWSVDSRDTGSEDLTGPGTRERTLSFSEAGSHTVTAAVTDVLGRTTTDTHTIQVIEATAPPESGAREPSGGGGTGSGSFDASTDFVAANSDLILDYSDLSFNNYADGDSAITLGNTAGPGDITLVSKKEAQDYLESYNWHNVNLGDLVDDNLVATSQARQIFKQARQNKDEHGSGAVGGINPYKSDATRQPPSPPSGMDSLTPPQSHITSTIDTGIRTDAEPQSSNTATITSGDEMENTGVGWLPNSTESQTDTSATESAPATSSESGRENKDSQRHGQGTVTLV